MAVFGADDRINITVVSNTGNGDVQDVSVNPNTTLRDWFMGYFGADANPKKYVVKVNKEGRGADYILQDGDAVTVTSTNIQAGRL